MGKMLNFPLTFQNFPSYDFFIGERVTSPKMPEGTSENPPYYRGGTVIGRFYAHPLYYPTDCIGWVYAILQTHYFFNSDRKQPKSDKYCQLIFIPEKELESLNNDYLEHEETPINPQQVPLIFADNPDIIGLLMNCQEIYLESHGAHKEWVDNDVHDKSHHLIIDVGSNDILMALIWSYQAIIRKRLIELHLPSFISFKFWLDNRWIYFDFENPQFETEEPQSLIVDFENAGRELEYTFTSPGEMVYSTPLPHIFIMDSNENQRIISLETCQKRAENYQLILTACSNPRTVVYLMDSEKLIYLDVKTFNPYRLNKNADKLLGNSLDVNDSQIGDLRRHYCQQAAKTGQIIEYSYSNNWNDLEWNFTSKIIPITSSELIVTVSDPVGEDWQTQYFLRYNPLNKEKVITT